MSQRELIEQILDTMFTHCTSPKSEKYIDGDRIFYEVFQAGITFSFMLDNVSIQLISDKPAGYFFNKSSCILESGGAPSAGGAFIMLLQGHPQLTFYGVPGLQETGKEHRTFMSQFNCSAYYLSLVSKDTITEYESTLVDKYWR